MRSTVGGHRRSTAADRAREGIIEAGLRILQNRGYEELSARAIAAAVGCSHMGIYRHFGSLAALEEVLAVEGYDRLRLAVRVPATGDLAADMGALARSYLAYVRRNRGLFELWQRGSSPRSRPVELDLLVQWWLSDGSLRQGGRPGVVPQVEVDMDAYFRRVAAALHGYAALEAAGVLAPSDLEAVLGPTVRPWASHGADEAGLERNAVARPPGRDDPWVARARPAG